uniref:Protein CASC3 n=1 Tax=Lepisosteus oculatus TaxID=7918 RepID=W5N7R0_LEPOC
MADRRRRRKRASQDTEEEDESGSGTESGNSGPAGGKPRARAPEPAVLPSVRVRKKSEDESECESEDGIGDAILSDYESADPEENCSHSEQCEEEEEAAGFSEEEGSKPPAEPKPSEDEQAGEEEEEEEGGGSKEVKSEEKGNLAGERQSGDGQESTDTLENKSSAKPGKKLDDDEDRKNPAYIPRKGLFFEHDVRGQAQEDDIRPKGRHRKLWKDEGRWEHDKFREDEQAPKSREELIALYGYDIRNANGPADGRSSRSRKPRYGSPPSRERRWRDGEKPSRASWHGAANSAGPAPPSQQGAPASRTFAARAGGRAPRAGQDGELGAPAGRQRAGPGPGPAQPERAELGAQPALLPPRGNEGFARHGDGGRGVPPVHTGARLSAGATWPRVHPLVGGGCPVNSPPRSLEREKERERTVFRLPRSSECSWPCIMLSVCEAVGSLDPPSVPSRRAVTRDRLQSCVPFTLVDLIKSLNVQGQIWQSPNDLDNLDVCGSWSPYCLLGKSLLVLQPNDKIYRLNIEKSPISGVTFFAVCFPGISNPLHMGGGPPQYNRMEELGRAKRYSSQRQRPVPEPAPMHIGIMEGHYYDPMPFQGPIYTHSESPAPLPPQGMLVQPEMHLPHPGLHPHQSGAPLPNTALYAGPPVSMSPGQPPPQQLLAPTFYPPPGVMTFSNTNFPYPAGATLPPLYPNPQAQAQVYGGVTYYDTMQQQAQPKPSPPRRSSQPVTIKPPPPEDERNGKAKERSSS